MDDWGWDQLRPWLEHRVKLPVGPLFYVVSESPEVPGRVQRCAGRCVTWLPRLACVGASPPTSFARGMPSRWPVRACR
jgi:hypothetical protein